MSELAKHFDPQKALYVEPFAGSAVLFFKLKPQRAILSDLNSQLINSLRVVRDQPAKVHRRLEGVPRSADEYYSIRERFNQRRSSQFCKAVQFIYLNRNCFNGLWRTDTMGRFNVPFGGDRMGKNPSLETFNSCAEQLRKASLRHRDFRGTLSAAMRSDSFVYLDPPYFAADERVFVEYGKKTFGAGDLDDLVATLPLLHRAGSHFLFSYRYDPDIIKRCRRWNIEVITVMRNIGGFSSSRKIERELLITNK